MLQIIRNDVGYFGNDQLARARYAARSSDVGVVSQELLNSADDMQRDSLRARRIVLSNVGS